MKPIRRALDDAASRLQSAGVPDARLDAEYLLAHVLSLSRLELKLKPDALVSAEDEQGFSALVEKRAARMPLQYVLGHESFMGLTFKTDARALIPRPETELLCLKALEALPNYPRPQKVLDLCTGTGAVGLSLKSKAPQTVLSLSDISPDALCLARENARHLGVSADFFQGDLFAPFFNQRFHIIVCNPPYIKAADCLLLQEEVQKEPVTALLGGEDGLVFYRRLAAEAGEHLLPGGMLLMEIGFDQGQSVPALFEKDYHGVTVYKDYDGLDRMVTCFYR